jgi:O-antigen/teichoic acid export membrane protein
MNAVSQPVLPEEQRPTGRKGHEGVVLDALTRNIGRDTLARIGYLLTRLLIPPFILARIGLPAYSVWSAIFILVSYVGITTMGVSVVYIKYTAEFTSLGETDKANSLLSTGMFSTAAICALIFGLLTLEMHQVLVWLRVPPSLLAEAQVAVLMVIATFLCGLVFGVFGQALAGSQKIAETQGVWVISYVAEVVLIFILVRSGHGLLGLAEAFLVRQVLAIGLNAFVAFRMLPWLRISPRRFSLDSLRRLTSFGGIVQISSLLSVALNTIERVIAGPLVGLTALGIMDLSDKWPTMSCMVADSFAASFIPAASYLKGGRPNKPFGDDEIVPRLYLRGARYMHVATSSLCALLAVASRPFLAAWLGPAYVASAYLMTIFAVQQNVHHMTGPGTSILKGIGLPKEELYYIVPNIIAAAAMIPLSRMILGHWSVSGLGSAVVIATLASASFFVAHANRILGVSWRTYLRSVVVPGLVPYIVGLCVAIPAWKLTDNVTRLHAAAIMGGVVVGYAVTLAIVLDRIVLSSDERSWFRLVIRREASSVFATIGLGESNERAA